MHNIKIDHFCPFLIQQMSLPPHIMSCIMINTIQWWKWHFNHFRNIMANSRLNGSFHSNRVMQANNTI